MVAQLRAVGVMLGDYEDILALVRRYNDLRGHLLVPLKPLWWDEHGVPRFCEHHPRHCPDIYADEVALVLISCQLCGTEMPVQMSHSASSARLHQMVIVSGVLGVKASEIKLPPPSSLAEAVDNESIHYGDPPYHEVEGRFCHAGCTMNVWDLRVIEFWHRPNREWIRVPVLEVDLPDLVDPERVG